MALNLDAIGTVGEPVIRTWQPKDALLYAIAVGASAYPLEELSFTTENTREVQQQVLPTFGVVLGMGGGSVLKNIGRFNPAMLVHAEQSIELAMPISPQGTLSITGTLVDIVDKRSGALVVTESKATDVESGNLVFSTLSGLFIRGEGGFSEGDSKEERSVHSGITNAPDPERQPDHVVSYPTLPQQALLYRLCGDRNPLHSDPAFAATAGFDRPILHGLCTYGFAGRALLRTLCDSDPQRFRSMSGRFSRPVLPGQTLTTEIYLGDFGQAEFRTVADDGTVVLDRGRCTYR